MSQDELLFFNQFPGLIPSYRRLKTRLEAAYPDLRLKISKTQISFYNRRMFAMVSLPWRRPKGWPAEYLLVSFGLGCRKESPRIAQAVEPYPNRWTHHVPVQQAEQIDDELLQWLDEAYQFAAGKR